jgi:hypothetical protein
MNSRLRWRAKSNAYGRPNNIDRGQRVSACSVHKRIEFEEADVGIKPKVFLPDASSTRAPTLRAHRRFARSTSTSPRLANKATSNNRGANDNQTYNETTATIYARFHGRSHPDLRWSCNVEQYDVTT